MLLGIDPNKFVKLMEIARAASKATGDTITKSFEDITIGIGRQSRMILDNLGIIVKVDDANKKYAKTLGISASALTDTQKKQAFLNATMLAGQKIIDGVGNTAEDSADKIAQMKVEIIEATNELKVGFADAVEGSAEEIATTTSVIIQSTRDLISSLNIVAHGFNEFIDFFILDDLKSAIKAGKKLIDTLDSTTTGGTRRISDRLDPDRAVSNGRKKIGFAGTVRKPDTGQAKFGELADTIALLEELDKKVKNVGIDFDALADQSDTSFGRMEQAVTGWASNFSGTLTDILFDSEVTFGNILESFVKMITQMAIQTQIIEPILGGLFRGGFSNAPISVPGGGPPNLRAPSTGKSGLFGLGFLGLADGGIVTKPTMAMIGEGGESEAVIPLSKLERMGGNVEVNIFGAPEGSRSEQTETEGGVRLDVFLDEEMSKNVRKGTKFHGALQKTFSNLNSSTIRR